MIFKCGNVRISLDVCKQGKLFNFALACQFKKMFVKTYQMLCLGKHQYLSQKICSFQMLFDENKIKMARKPGKKQRENPVGCTGGDKR